MSEASRDHASDRGPRADDDSCSHDGCPRDDELVERRLTDTGFVGTYCARHDPLDDPAVAEHFDGSENGGGAV